MVCGRPARMKLWRAPSLATAAWKTAERNAWALSPMTRSSFQPRAAIGRPPDGAPAGLGQLGDANRTEAGMAQGEGDHPLLDQHAGLVRHPQHPALTWPQDLGPMAVQLPLPAVGAGGVDPHGPTGSPPIAKLSGDREHPWTTSVPQVILRHGDASSLLDLAVRTKEASPLSVSGGCAPASLHLGDRTN
jgi:hypothetical protein